MYRLLLLRIKKNQSTKILLVAEYGKGGGTRTYFISLLYFLKKQQYQVTVLMNNWQADPEIDNLLVALDVKTLRVKFDFWCIDLDNPHPGLTKKQLISYQLREMLFWCNILTKEPFFTIVFSVGDPGRYLYALLLPVKIRYILHTQPMVKADKYKRWLLASQLSSSKQIITVSFSSKKTIESFWLNTASNNYVNVIYNFYEPKFKNIGAVKMQHVKNVLTIGDLEYYKNPFLFIDCAMQIIDRGNKTSVTFTWAGGGSLLQECRDRAKEYPQIKFIDFTDNVEKLYNEATIYYQPSLLESHGISALGAMYHRLACIVSDHGGLKESVEDNKSGFVVTVTDVTASVEKLQLLLYNNSLCKEMGSHGYVIYEKKFTKIIWESKMMVLFS